MKKVAEEIGITLVIAESDKAIESQLNRITREPNGWCNFITHHKSGDIRKERFRVRGWKYGKIIYSVC